MMQRTAPWREYARHRRAPSVVVLFIALLSIAAQRSTARADDPQQVAGSIAQPPAPPAIPLPGRSASSGSGAHAIVVFGTPVAPDGRLQARLERALELAHRDPASVVVVTGGLKHGTEAEGPMMARWLRQHGLPRHRVLVEDQALFTHDNAVRVLPLLRAAGAGSVTVVTHQYHLRRARFHMRWALRLAGIRGVAVGGAGVAGGLKGRHPGRVWLDEQRKLVRGVGSVLRDARGRMLQRFRRR